MIPEGVTTIGDHVFYCCPHLTLPIPRNSYTATYAQQNAIPYTYTD